MAALAALAVACGEHDVSRQLGARCSDSDECDERCLPPAGAYPGGFCTVICDRDGDCPSGSSCAADSGGVCLFTSDRDSDCGFLDAGWSCREVAAKPQGTVKVCRGS